MKTRLRNFAQLNYPIDFEMSRSNLMRWLQQKCKNKELNAVKEGRIWFVINDGSFDNQAREARNPLL